jgi:hypothetical protein
LLFARVISDGIEFHVIMALYNTVRCLEFGDCEETPGGVSTYFRDIGKCIIQTIWTFQYNNISHKKNHLLVLYVKLSGKCAALF